jgi:hypothetical protein
VHQYRPTHTAKAEDESIHDALIRRRMWTPEGIRPIVTVEITDHDVLMS